MAKGGPEAPPAPGESLARPLLLPSGLEVRGARWEGGLAGGPGTRGRSQNALSSGGQCGVSLYPKAAGQPLEKNKTKT